MNYKVLLSLLLLATVSCFAADGAHDEYVKSLPSRDRYCGRLDGPPTVTIETLESTTRVTITGKSFDPVELTVVGTFPKSNGSEALLYVLNRDEVPSAVNEDIRGYLDGIISAIRLVLNPKKTVKD